VSAAFFGVLRATQVRVPVIEADAQERAEARSRRIEARERGALPQLREESLQRILGVGGGLLLDSWLHTSPIFTLVGMVLGIGAAMYTIWDVAKQSMGR